MMDHDVGGVPRTLPGDLVRTVDLLDQQRRRILDLSALVVAGRRQLQLSTAALSWRSPARFEFDARLSDLSRALARTSAALHAALEECDRARDLVRSVLSAGAEGSAGLVGSPGHGLR